MKEIRVVSWKNNQKIARLGSKSFDLNIIFFANGKRDEKLDVN